VDEKLWQQFHAGDRRALSRLLSHAANGENLREIAAHLAQSPRTGRVVAITGSAGVGKSTLIGKLIDYLRDQGLRIGILACDPQSPVSGGALLGDRFRMPNRPDDDGLFIRSLAALSGHGAIADHLSLMTRLLEAFGFDTILIETVGAGQGDTNVHEVADAVILLLQPETGDDLQWEKAGILELTDLLVVHKADMPTAENTAAQVRSMLDLSSSRQIPVLLASSKTGKGIDEVGKAIMKFSPRAVVPRSNDDVLEAAQALLARKFRKARQASEPKLAAILDSYQAGRLSQEEAGQMLLGIL